MRAFSMREIAEVTGGRLLSGSGDEVVTRVSKDSRDVTPDSLFFALIGKVHDAHVFLPQVKKNGCNNFIISRQDAMDFEGSGDTTAVLVDDTEEALVRLAVFVLKEMGAVVIGVTGSVGKTSTKDMVHSVCSQQFKTGKTEANLNTNIGISMCVLGFAADTKVAVLEIGTDHPGEIDGVVRVFRPHICLITNIGQSHLERFGTREAIFRAKMEIANYFKPDDLLVIQKGEDYLRKENIPHDYRIQSVGTDEDNEYVVSGITLADGTGTVFDLAHRGETIRVKLPVLGAHHALNAAQAVAVGIELGIPMEKAALGLQSLEMTGGRLDVRSERGLHESIVIDDTYNASPDSMRSGLQTLASLPGTRKVAILGDMLELGEDTRTFHREVGAFAWSHGIDLVLGVGTLAKDLVEAAGPNATHYEDKEALIAQLPDLIKQDDIILVKASRGMALDEVVDYLLGTKEKK